MTNESGEVGLYIDPCDERYEQRGDGRWYMKHNLNCGGLHLAAALGDKPCAVCGEDKWCTGTPVGDINSDKKGTGARALGPDKDPLQWIPVRYWLDYFMSIAFNCQRDTGMERAEVGYLLSCVQALSEFQEGKGTGREMKNQLSPELMVEACRVFEYGANKYKAWNWMKGMPWSVVTGCALRHMKAVFEGELLDDESGLPHVGHFACNIIMLAMYDSTYQAGNDFPKEEYFNE